ncbi:MAG: homoserine dehydrogenase [Actinomycetia bacterium]|nr:homoserine dehydrogenase [Actinomycetes bacterium]
MNGDDTVRIGILGCGNVGSALVRLIIDQADVIEGRTGVHLEIARVAVRNLSRERDVPLPASVFTHDAAEVVDDPTIDVVVEVIGGIEPARELIMDALKAGKPVVTANKELLANVGREIFETAEFAGVDLLFEAAVAGGIPFIRPLRESLVGERIRRVLGIVNGTTNFILTRMSEDGSSFHDALGEAQSLGYAERDPTADVEGFDAAAKTAIIASIAFGARVVAGDVYREGISELTAHDMQSARQLGYVVKLLAIAEEIDGSIAVRVHPAMVPTQHPLASVRDSFNALFLEGDAVGELMFYGRGAGGGPTASAVLGDLIDAAKNLASGSRGATIGTLARKPIMPIDEVESMFYVMVEAADQPGVLATIANVFGENRVSIRSMQQSGLGDDARLTFVTHRAREADLRRTVHQVRELEAVRRIGTVLRVIGDGA